MELVLQIVNGAGSGARESDRRKAFGSVGGRIGRAADCEWVLPSPYVSRHHATVSHAGNTFYIESTGENGVALNDPRQMLARFERHALKDGDMLFIDEMEISVSLTTPGVASDAALAIPELHASTVGPLDPAVQELDPLKRLLGDAPGTLAETAERAIPWNNSSSLADHFAPPKVVPAIAEDWDEEALNRRAAQSDLQSDLQSDVQSDLSRPAIEGFPSEDLLQATLQGLITERQTRVQLAADLRLHPLTLTASNGNPLNHAINADDALRLLEAGRMTCSEAISDALDEIRAHEQATAAAIRSAFRRMMITLEPRALEARFDKRLRHAGVLPIGSKFRYWQLYVELFEELSSGADGGFQKLFGEAFAEAYELQLSALKGRAGQPAHGT